MIGLRLSHRLQAEPQWAGSGRWWEGLRPAGRGFGPGLGPEPTSHRCLCARAAARQPCPCLSRRTLPTSAGDTPHYIVFGWTDRGRSRPGPVRRAGRKRGVVTPLVIPSRPGQLSRARCQDLWWQPEVTLLSGPFPGPSCFLHRALGSGPSPPHHVFLTGWPCPRRDRALAFVQAVCPVFSALFAPSAGGGSWPRSQARGAKLSRPLCPPGGRESPHVLTECSPAAQPAGRMAAGWPGWGQQAPLQPAGGPRAHGLTGV